MAENTVFLFLTALVRNFYKAIIHRLDVKRFGLKAASRIKAFVFRFVSVPAKWIRTSRRYVLNIYTCNNAYADVFQTGCKRVRDATLLSIFQFFTLAARI